MTFLAKGLSWLISGTSTLAGVLVILMVAHVTLDVVMRYVFQSPLNATILYVSAFYMVAISFLPLGAVEQRNGHIAVELLVERFPNRIQTVLLFLSTLLTAIVTAVVAYRTGLEAWSKYDTGSFSIEAGGKIITWPTYLSLPLGFGLMSLVALWKLFAMLTGRAPSLGGLTVTDPYLTEDKPNV